MCTQCLVDKEAEAFSKGQYPCKACQRVARRARTLRENPDAKELCVGTLAERFAYYFDANVTEPFDQSISVPGCPNAPCRVGWKGARNSDGYPQMRANEQTILVHRWLYELHRGPIPVGYGVRHLCNRKCLTLSHLSADTHTQNMADKVAAGTAGRGLSVEQVRTILRLKAEGESYSGIARGIGCTQGTVRQILNGETYKEISRVLEPAGYQFGMF